MMQGIEKQKSIILSISSHRLKAHSISYT